MGNRFLVNLDALASAGRGVSSLMEELDRHRVSDLACESSAVGHEGLAGALGEFCDRWQRGVANLSKDGHEFANRLTTSARCYGDVDQAVTDAIRRIGRAA